MNAADRSFYASLFARIAEEMGGALTRTAYSPNIKERRDFSCALFNAEGQLVAQAAHIPVHLGALPMSVRAALDACSEWNPGDGVLLNDPFTGGTHLPDLTLITPLHSSPRARKPFAYLATRAHHADVGGISPGSLPISTEIYQEGLRLPPVKLYERGHINEDILRIICANTRTPDERIGDLRAQWSAHEVGGQRMQEVLARHGTRQARLAMQDLLEYGETLMRSTIEQIPDGQYSFTDQLDDDGIGNNPLPIRVAIDISGGDALINFAGTAPTCQGNLNAVEAITQSAVYYCFLCLLVTPSNLHRDKRLNPPLNAGCFRPLTIHAPRGTIVNAEPPCAVAGANVETSQRIVDTVFGALAQALPDVIPAASQGTMNNITLGGTHHRTGQPFAYYETIAGGTGGHPKGKGLDAVQTHMTNTLNTPIEALEFAYPLRVERYALATGSGGRGQHQGGAGILRELRALNAMQGVIISERRTYPPYGLAGGTSGQCGENRLIRKGRTEILPGKVTLDLQAGDRICIRTPGGGGWGRAGDPT